MPHPDRRILPASPADAGDAGLLQGVLEHLGGAVLVCDTQGSVRWANRLAVTWLGPALPDRSNPAGAADGGPVAADAASPGPGAGLRGFARLPPLRELALPWVIPPPRLAAVCDGEALLLPPAALAGADGIVRRCKARLTALPREGAAPLALLWIEEQVGEAGASLSDSQHRRALAAAQVGSWSRHFADGVARVDPLWCHALGLDPCEGPGHLERWSRRIHPDDVGRFRRAGELLAAAVEGAPDFDVEYRILTTDSRWLWVLQRGRVCQRDPRGGAPLEAAGICIEIDARKRAEVEVHENESRLATALWGAQAAFWQFHIPSDTATRSPLWFAMTGYTEQSWNSIPAPWTSRLHPDDRTVVEALLAEHMAGRSQSIELRYRTRCADGSWKWMMDRGRVVEWDFDGRPIGAIGVSIDIDAQKRAEIALHASQTRLDTAIWGAGVGLYELDCASGVTRWLNDWCERFDIDACAGAEHVDRWDSNIHPEDLPAARARFTAHLEGHEEYYDAEYRIRMRSGGWRWIFERGRVTDRDVSGAPVRLVGTCMDIDARRRVELAAEDSRRRLELALESAQGCLWEWDIATSQYNNAYYELHGVAPQEGRRQRTFWSDRAHPEDRERVLDAERELIEGRIDSFNAQYRVRHADGSWRWMVDRFRAGERDEQGRATRLIGFAMDVTGDVRMREALQASEAALRAVTANSPDWLFLIGRDLRIRFINHGVRGMQPEALIGRDALAVVDPAWRPVVQRHFERVFASGEPQAFDLTRTPAGGVARVFLHRVTAVRADDGTVEGLAVVATDVTQQREAALALQRSERTLRTVTASANDWLLLLDRDSRVRFVNRPIGGREVESMIGRDVIGMVPPAQVDAMREMIANVLGDGAPRVMLQRLASPDPRRVRYLEAWVTPAREGKRIVGTMLTITDVTERLRQQQALQAQASILETMSEAVLLVDRNDVAKMVNPAFEALACSSREGMIGQPLTELLRNCVAEYAEITTAAVAHWETRPPTTTLRREFDWRSPDGRTRRLLAAFTRMEFDGVGHVLAVFTDLTEQREVERQILDVVQRAQRRIGADLHDGLGQELTGIALLLRGLQNEVADGRAATPARIAEVIGHVNHSIETARTMARGLAPVDPEHGGLGGALQRLAASASRQSGVHVEVRCELPPSLLFSQEQSTHLFRIAQEAVSNALRHAAARSVKISLTYATGFASLRISDDGRGFPDSEEPQRGLGLKTMRFRASVLRGDFQIVRRSNRRGAGSGITLICRVPVHS
jgi:PAS domain S-box-containing protein